MLKDKKFYNTFTPHNGTFKITNAKVKSMMGWQRNCFRKISDESYAVIQAPCGSGKTLMQIWLAIHDVYKNNLRRKQLIVTPQSHIGIEFCLDDDNKNYVVEYKDRHIDWYIGENLCGKDISRTLLLLRKFLLTPAAILSRDCTDIQISGLTCVSTHQALALVWKSLSEDEKFHAMENLTLRIDEGHHVKLAYTEEELLESGYNKQEIFSLRETATILGNICSFVMSNKQLKTKLHFTTATFFRGDSYNIISESMAKEFKFFNLSWLDYWKTTSIREMWMSYKKYDGNDPVLTVAEQINSEPSNYHLIIVPPTGERFRTTNTIENIKNTVKLPQTEILDLIDVKQQGRNKDLLKKFPLKYHVVIACSLFNEGTNWKPCDRIHNTACERSPTLAVQRVGRCLREFPNKTIVKVFYYVNHNGSGENIRKKYTDHTNAICVSMVVEGLFNPTLIPKLPVGKMTKKGATGEVVTMHEVFDYKYYQVIREIMEGLHCVGTMAEDVEMVINNVVTKYYNGDIPTDNIVCALKKVLLNQIPESAQQITDIDFEMLRNKFDQIWPMFPENYSMCLGVLTPEKMDDLRRMLKNKDTEFLKKISKVRSVGIDNIPYNDPLYKWLKDKKKLWEGTEYDTTTRA